MKKANGFTLIELIIVMAIVGILATFAFPTFKETMINNRLYSEASRTTSLITLARSEAMRRNGYVGVCPTDDASTCSFNRDVSTGMLVYATDSTGIPITTIIKITDKWTADDKGKFDFLVPRSSSPYYFVFTAGGDIVQNSIGILVCKPSYPSFTIDINHSGRIITTRNPTDNGCFWSIFAFSPNLVTSLPASLTGSFYHIDYISLSIIS